MLSDFELAMLRAAGKEPPAAAAPAAAAPVRATVEPPAKRPRPSPPPVASPPPAPAVRLAPTLAAAGYSLGRALPLPPRGSSSSRAAHLLQPAAGANERPPELLEPRAAALWCLRAAFLAIQHARAYATCGEFKHLNKAMGELRSKWGAFAAAAASGAAAGVGRAVTSAAGASSKAALEAAATATSTLTKTPPPSHPAAAAATLAVLGALDSLYGAAVAAWTEVAGGWRAGKADASTAPPPPLPNPVVYLGSFVGDPHDAAAAAAPSTSPLEAYLQLREVEAAALGLPKLIAAAAEAQGGLRPGPVEGTMRGPDPLAFPALQQWWDGARDRVASWGAFACPSPAALQALLDFAGEGGAIVEVGAGTGYWARALTAAAKAAAKAAGSAAAVRVRAFDKDPPPLAAGHAPPSGSGSSSSSSWNEYHGLFGGWAPVEKATAAGVGAVLQSEARPGGAGSGGSFQPVLLLVYPPPACPMAEEALAAYPWQRLAYVGEWDGDTATRGFQAKLISGWELDAALPLPQWGNTANCLMLWRRKKAGGRGGGGREARTLSSGSPLHCAGCGAHVCAPPPPSQEGAAAAAAHYYRDRLTRAVAVCSAKSCQTAPATVAALRAAAAVRSLQGLLPPPFAAGGEAGARSVEEGAAEPGAAPSAMGMWRKIKVSG